MNRSSMSKQMMQEGGPVVPSKEEFAAMTPEQQAAQKKKAMMQNLNLTPKEKADKEAMEKEGIFSNMGGPAVSTAKKIAKMASGNKDKPKKKMNMGGMATANKYDKNKKERMHEADLQSGRLRMDKSPNPNEKPTEDQTDYDISDPAGFNKGGMAKKMARGGMTSKMSKQKGGNTVIVDPAKKSPKSRMKTSGSSSKMAMMKKGGKVRGYGMARGGKACKMR